MFRHTNYSINRSRSIINVKKLTVQEIKDLLEFDENDLAFIPLTKLYNLK